MITDRCDFCGEIKPLKEWSYLLKATSSSYTLKANLCGKCYRLVEEDIWKCNELIHKLQGLREFKTPGAEGREN